MKLLSLFSHSSPFLQTCAILSTRRPTLFISSHLVAKGSLSCYVVAHIDPVVQRRQATSIIPTSSQTSATGSLVTTSWSHDSALACTPFFSQPRLVHTQTQRQFSLHVACHYYIQPTRRLSSPSPQPFVAPQTELLQISSPVLRQFAGRLF